jgi:putative transposase|uniref:Transposase n=1 Tax=candidate division WOR-3 bacterium TaxID=2052148 RepID=A0A7C6AGX3_UNCW3
MPRIARSVVDGLIYHILNRGNGGQIVFRKEQDYRVFIELISSARIEFDIRIFAYCIMPNHFHIVAMPLRGENLSNFMHLIMTTHVRRYHKHYGTSGHIWQGRYKSFIVQENNYLLTVLRYVEGNPVRAKLVNSAVEWEWSSHRERINLIPNKILSNPLIDIPSHWTKFVDEPLSFNDLEKLRNSINRQAPYGEEEWQIQICKNLGLESTIRPRGRPAKWR